MIKVNKLKYLENQLSRTFDYLGDFGNPGKKMYYWALLISR